MTVYLPSLTRRYLKQHPGVGSQMAGRPAELKLEARKLLPDSQ